MGLVQNLEARGLKHPVAMLLGEAFGPPVPVASGGTGATTPQGATQNLGTWFILAASGAQVAHTGNTAETVLATVTVPANSLGANGAIRLNALWSNNNSGNNKTFRVRYSGIGGTAFVADVKTTTVVAAEHLVIQNRNATNSQVGRASDANVGGWQQNGTGTSTSAADTTASTTLVITGQLADGADSIALEQYVVEVMRMA